MKLSYKDLRKRDVINVEDGKCLGRITNIELNFPEGVLVGIIVPGRKGFRLFDRSELYIDQSKIIKIGGDVILVNINCGSVCSPNINLNKKPPRNPNSLDCCPPMNTPPCDNSCSSRSQDNGNCFPHSNCRKSVEELMGSENWREDEY